MRNWCICLGLALGLLAVAPVQATIVQITASGTSFSPSTVTIAVGDTIQWQRMFGSHTTTNGTGAADPNAGILWDEPLTSISPLFERQFTVLGVFPYFCRPHEFAAMKGTITVAEPNNIPVARDTALSTIEDTPVGGQLHGSDLDGDPLAFFILTGPFHGTLTAFDGATGAFTYEPAQDFNGEDTLTFEVHDGKDPSPPGTALIAVSPVNDPPVAADVVVLATTNTLEAVGAMPVTDVDDVSWTISHTSGPFHGSVAGFNAGTGSFDYSPDADYFGPDSIKYTADDGDDLSNEGTIRISVNSPPVARDTALATAEDTPVAGQLHVVNLDGDALTITVLMGPSHGSLTAFDGSSGTFTYTPTLNFNGADSIIFEADDGLITSSPGIARITVAAVNDPPVAEDVSVLVIQNTLESVGAMPVTDVDDAAWTVAHLTGPHNGSISGFDPASGSFDYTPDLDYLGPDSITYQADDGTDPSNTGVIRITVATGCACDCHADPQCDGVTNIFDMVFAAAVGIRNEPDVIDPNPLCPRVTTDVNCDGITNIFDLVHLSAVGLRNEDPADHFCDPCQ